MSCTAKIKDLAGFLKHFPSALPMTGNSSQEILNNRIQGTKPESVPIRSKVDINTKMTFFYLLF